MSKLKNTRFFLCDNADSYVHLTVPNKDDYDDSYSLKMADCNRSIRWEFYPGKPGSKHAKKHKTKALKKLSKFRDLVNKLYEEIEAS